LPGLALAALRLDLGLGLCLGVLFFVSLRTLALGVAAVVDDAASGEELHDDVLVALVGAAQREGEDGFNAGDRRRRR
jgi:hypothetical protein